MAGEEDRPTGSGWTIPTLKIMLENTIVQADARNDVRFRAAEIAVNTALTAQEKTTGAAFAATAKATDAAFAASEKAVAAAFAASERASAKAEEAQKNYNERSNEFRGQLDDQAKTFITRSETETHFGTIDDKISAVQAAGSLDRTVLRNTLEEKLVALQITVEKTTDRLTQDIKELRQYQATVLGRQSRGTEVTGYTFAAVLAAVSIAAGIAGHFIH